MCGKFQGEKIHLEKDIRILPTCVFGRMIFKNFTHKMTLFQGLKKSFSQQHMLVDFEYL